MTQAGPSALLRKVPHFREAPTGLPPPPGLLPSCPRGGGRLCFSSSCLQLPTRQGARIKPGSDRVRAGGSTSPREKGGGGALPLQHGGPAFPPGDTLAGGARAAGSRVRPGGEIHRTTFVGEETYPVRWPWPPV